MQSSRTLAPALVLWCSLALLSALGAGCPANTGPSVNIPVPSGTPEAAPPTARPPGPIVLFTVRDGLLAPVVCHDGRKAVPADSPECMSMAPEGATVVLDTGEKAKLGPAGKAACRGSTSNDFEGRKAESPGLEKAAYGIWPEAARGVVTPSDGALKATAAELAAMVALLRSETGGLFESPPKLEVTSGLSADIDGDGAPDRVLAAFNDGRLYGVVAAFLAKAPGVAVNLSVQQFDYPKLAGVTELDGMGGHEVWISAAFIEGIEDHNVTSGLSERVIALRDGKPQELGAWGCRIF